MNRCLKNNYFISLMTFIYCTCIGIVCAVGNGFKFVILNTILFASTIILNLIMNQIFFIAIDIFVRKKTTFKLRFFELIKSLWISQLILLPVSIIMCTLTFFMDFSPSIVMKIIIFTLRYLCPIFLFFCYKQITKSDWITTIKVVSGTFIIMTFIGQVYRLI